MIGTSLSHYRITEKLGEEYWQFALPIIQLQLVKSAVRVASTLNQIFK